MIKTLFYEIEQFKKWACTVPKERQFAEWECDYPNWNKIYFELENTDLDDLYHFLLGNVSAIESILYIMARDNEVECIADRLSNHENLLLLLASESLYSNEPDAKWQCVVNIQHCKDKKEVERLLGLFISDKDEYVNRRSLMAMAKIIHPDTQNYCQLFWDRDIYGDLQEYQRMAVLQALHDIDSCLLDKYLLLAKKDGRKHLLQNAERIIKERENRTS